MKTDAATKYELLVNGHLVYTAHKLHPNGEEKQKIIDTIKSTFAHKIEYSNYWSIYKTEKVKIEPLESPLSNPLKKVI